MRNKSFTLIELLVVIVIIGILAGVIIVSTSSSIGKANFAKAQAFSSTVQEELLLNLVSEWTFDNESNLGEDTWGNNDGIIIGSVASEEDLCVFGKCAYFPGVVGNYIQVNNSSSLENINEITLSFWFKNYTTGTSQGPISKIYGIRPFWSIWLSNSRHYVWEVGDATLSYYRPAMNYIFNNDNWYYVTIVQSNTNYVIYSNSEVALKNNDSCDFSETKSDRNLLIGSLTTTSYPFKGYIDDVRIYNGALSTSQIKQNYIAGLNSLLANNSISKQEYDQRLNNLAYDKE